MVEIKIIGREYNQRMREIISSNPMITPNYDLLFDKGPDFFVSEHIWPIKLTYYGIFEDNLLVGMGSHSAYNGYLNGEEIIYNHFGNFCVDAQYQNRGLFNKLSSFMAQNVITANNLGFAQIIKGNKAPERYFTVEDIPLEGMPRYKRRIVLVSKTLLLIWKKRPIKGFDVRFATEKDLNKILSFLEEEYPKRTMSFSFKADWFQNKINGVYDLCIKDYLLVFKEGKLVGLCGVWDMKSIKRTKILRYKGRMKVVYHLLKLNLNLPKPGSNFKELYLTDLIIKNEDADILKALLVGINNYYITKGYLLVHFSSYKNSPMLSGSSLFFGFKMFSNIFFKSNDATIMKSFDSYKNFTPYFDISYM